MDDRLKPLPPTVRSVSCFRYRIPLTSPVRIGGRALETRAGILLRLTDREANEGWGEAAPLPGFSPESIEAVERAAKKWAEGGIEVGPASLAFAIDTALFNLRSQHVEADAEDAFAARHRIIDINALIADDDAPVAAGIAAREAGFSTIKMKVGQRRVEDDIERVHQLAAVSDAMTIRLDANRAWDLGAARAFLAGIEGLAIDYLEEPLQSAQELPLLASHTEIPVALDETLREIEPEEVASFGFCRAIVLKPSLVGSFERYRRFLDAAGGAGMSVVLSGAFESGVATQMLIALAAALPVPTAHGLEPYRRLAADVLVPRLPIAGPRIRVDEAAAIHRVDRDSLEKVW